MSANLVKKLPIKSFKAANGQIYNALRYHGHSVPLPKGPKASRAVQSAAKEALKALQLAEADRPTAVKKARGPTFSDGVSRYLDTPAFRALRASTQEKRRSTLNVLCRAGYGAAALAMVERSHVRAMISAREETPAAARNVLIALRHFFQERVNSGLLHEDKDPTLGVKLDKRIVKRFGTYPTWTQEHVDQFRAHWGWEHMERVAFELMLLTGMAVADVIRFSRSWIGKDKLIRYARMKTSSQSIQAFTPEVEAILAKLPVDIGPLLRDQLGRIWYKPGATPTGKAADEGWRNADFSQWFTKACRKAGLPAGIAAHGVRKRAACNDALLGWSERKLMHKFGWADNGEVVLYTKMAEAEQMMLAEVAKDAAD